MDADLPRIRGSHSVSGRDAARPVVYFDGGCPLCAREIAHYRRCRGAERLCWLDVTGAGTQQLARHGLTREQAMTRFHVRDASGCWQTGAWGFAELWSHLDAYRWLARLLHGLHLLPALDAAYRGFARWRWRRRCAAGVCGLPVESGKEQP